MDSPSYGAYMGIYRNTWRTYPGLFDLFSLVSGNDSLYFIANLLSCPSQKPSCYSHTALTICIYRCDCRRTLDSLFRVDQDLNGIHNPSLPIICYAVYGSIGTYFQTEENIASRHPCWSGNHHRHLPYIYV